MNVKINMPKFGRKMGFGGMAKELLLTFIGTTLSIILTFGTAHYLEQKQLRADGRQTAMIVIHDMENCAKTIENYAKREEDDFQQTQYVIEHLDRIQSISIDTLKTVMYYVTQYSRLSRYQYDDSSEKLFLSDQDVWKSINNATFIDIAQRFFYTRRLMYEGFDKRESFVRPIPYEEISEFDSQSASVSFDYAEFLKERLTRPSVKYFLVNYQQRARYFSEYLNVIQEYVKRCKFIMDISDEELKSYLEHRKHGGHPLKQNKLIGTWILYDDLDHYTCSEFKADNTMVTVNIYHMAHPYYVGRVDLKYVYPGTWELKGDSIFMDVSYACECTLDTSNIHLVAGKEKEMRQLLAEWSDYAKNAQEEGAKADSTLRSAWAAFMDRSGRKIEAWRVEEDGSESCFYLTRKEENER